MSINQRIQIFGNKTPNIGGNSENLSLYLSDLNAENIRERIGKEKIIVDEENLVITSGTIFKQGENRLQGYRYLIKDENGSFVGCLNVTRINRSYVISNIYVRFDQRRKGLATKLVERAQENHPGLLLDSSLTEQGAKFFGYQAPQEKKRNHMS